MNSARSAALFSRLAPRFLGESHWGAEILPNLRFNGTVSACWKGTQCRRRSQAPLLQHSLRRSFTTSSLFLKAKQSTEKSKGHEGKTQGQAKPEPNSKAKSKKKKAVNEPSKEITTVKGPIPGPSPLGKFFRLEALKLSGAFIPRKGLEPEKEFKRLAGAFRMERNWTGKRSDDIVSLRDVDDKERKKRWARFWESDEAKDLRKRFHQAIEDEFNWLLSRNQKVMKGMKPWEYLSDLFGVGKAPLTRDEAEKVLRPVKVNIYDFIAAERHYLKTGKMKLPRRFKDDRELGKYSKRKHKVYPKEDAKEDGVLVLLLRRIRQYF
ncbi:hypothetical protein BDZ91DRAFT_713679 [Kalaharituber pfeilii]|nr:hypothetical protein BDZ91DRAFT_713679 [Kalaharituber pfeilii]